MARILGNRLLYGSICGFGLYWAVGLGAPKPYVASLASLMLLIMSGMTLWRWGPTAFDIVAHSRRADESGAEGSHLAVYGTALIALGLHTSAWYRLLWVYFGSPATWSNSAFSSAGAATAGVGLCLMYFSPDVSRTQMKTPNTLWLVTVIAVGLLMAFFLGTRMPIGDDDHASIATIRYMVPMAGRLLPP